jgi:acyl-CoA hydrolase/GNAT superfamily N-acetyltransferase
MNKKGQSNINTKWKTDYKDNCMTSDAAIMNIKAGQRVFIGTGCAQPEELVHSLVRKKKEFVDIEIVHLLTSGEAPYARKELTSHFQINSFFISKNVRQIINEGLGDYTPIFLSDIPNLFSSGQLPIDTALIQVSPPDKNGNCSLGISVDIVKSAAENASLVIAQVNPQMTYTLGDSFINIHDIDILVPCDTPLIEIKQKNPSKEIMQIGEYIAALIEDGSTIEFGIGDIPQSVLLFLKNKKDLGIHTEMFTDSIIDLMESGVINGKMKSTNRCKVVASFCMGTKKLYKYIDNNPDFMFSPTEYVNAAHVISKQYKQVSINVALEVDLTGQVCADSIGSEFYSGIGGQVDFNRGASGSYGGKPIIALQSTAKKGTVSRIKPFLTPGAGVVTTRGDVHYLVTEFGVAYLHGKNIHERALSLISIAHPKFRAQLTKKAIELKYLHPDYEDIENKIVIGPQELKTSFVLNDGTLLSIRPMHPTDGKRIQDLFHKLSRQTVYYRFLSNKNSFQKKEIQDFVFINHRTDIAIVVTIPEASGEEIIAIGRYYLDEKTNFAEIAFIVNDEWQGKGIGSFLLKYLSVIAIGNGISGFTAEVLRGNRPMQSVLNKSEFKVTSKPTQDVYSYCIEFT